MTGPVPFRPGISEAFFVLTRASLRGKREQIKLETLAGIWANLCSSRLGEIIISRERSARPQCSFPELLQVMLGNKQVGSQHQLKSFNPFYLYDNVGLSAVRSTTCVQMEVSQQLMDGLPWNVLQTFIVHRGWILLSSSSTSRSNFHLFCETSQHLMEGFA